jgi:hypothetical protein
MTLPIEGILSMIVLGTISFIVIGVLFWDWTHDKND